MSEIQENSSKFLIEIDERKFIVSIKNGSFPNSIFDLLLRTSLEVERCNEIPIIKIDGDSKIFRKYISKILEKDEHSQFSVDIPSDIPSDILRDHISEIKYQLKQLCIDISCYHDLHMAYITHLESKFKRNFIDLILSPGILSKDDDGYTIIPTSTNVEIDQYIQKKISHFKYKTLDSIILNGDGNAVHKCETMMSADGKVSMMMVDYKRHLLTNSNLFVISERKNNVSKVEFNDQSKDLRNLFPNTIEQPYIDKHYMKFLIDYLSLSDISKYNNYSRTSNCYFSKCYICSNEKEFVVPNISIIFSILPFSLREIMLNGNRQ